MDFQKFEISDSELDHNDWRFPTTIKTRRLLDPDEEVFLVNHKVRKFRRNRSSSNTHPYVIQIDRSYDDSTVRFKLLVGNGKSANLVDSTKLPLRPDILQIVKEQKWVSDEYEHLWRRDGGGSTFLTSHGILTFLLQTPRDGRSFCSLSLVNRERHHCGGVYVANEEYNLQSLLGNEKYNNRHPKVPRDFAVLPLNILIKHVEETLIQVERLSRDMTSTEKRISDGEIHLENNEDYKLLNRLNLEHIRLMRRSDFEIELADNLTEYINEYHRMWSSLWEGGISYIEETKEKIQQQVRYHNQVRRDLDILPQRIKNQGKAVGTFIIQRDNKLNIQLAESNRRIAEESRRDNLLNLEMAAATAQVAEETRQDSAAMKTIAVLGLTFLPGTAVAVSVIPPDHTGHHEFNSLCLQSFFSMTMFQWPFKQQDDLASPYVYVYFAVTIPLTLVVYAAWVWWFRVSQARHKTAHEEGVVKFERELKMRVRSATGTW
ncbi:hypothetical protein LTR62_000104 [Meristemomyces frigidus]|uniref:Uncharacterized protein n=1 Tax=Meristemomyces frigidus TaxID=1508187 RepID=A0AAN7TR05_9PEZI|nr:hypothetical protein LTR62_000104 [Meristemomyces frigidus]